VETRGSFRNARGSAFPAAFYDEAVLIVTANDIAGDRMDAVLGEAELTP